MGIFSNIHANGCHILAAHAGVIPSRKRFYSAGIFCSYIWLYRILGVGLIKRAKIIGSVAMDARKYSKVDTGMRIMGYVMDGFGVALVLLIGYLSGMLG